MPIGLPKLTVAVQTGGHCGTLRYPQTLKLKNAVYDLSMSHGRNCRPGAKLIYFGSVPKSDSFSGSHSETTFLMPDNLWFFDLWRNETVYTSGLPSAQAHGPKREVTQDEGLSCLWRLVLQRILKSFSLLSHFYCLASSITIKWGGG